MRIWKNTLERPLHLYSSQGHNSEGQKTVLMASNCFSPTHQARKLHRNFQSKCQKVWTCLKHSLASSVLCVVDACRGSNRWHDFNVLGLIKARSISTTITKSPPKHLTSNGFLVFIEFSCFFYLFIFFA